MTDMEIAGTAYNEIRLDADPLWHEVPICQRGYMMHVANRARMAAIEECATALSEISPNIYDLEYRYVRKDKAAAAIRALGENAK